MERPEVPLKRITPELVLETYRYLLKTTGRSSCGSSAEQLDRMGYVSPRGDKVSRMAVWRMMMEGSEGKILLSKTKQRIGRIDKFNAS